MRQNQHARKHTWEHSNYFSHNHAPRHTNTHLLEGVLREKFKTEYVQYTNEALVLSRLESEASASRRRVKNKMS